MSIIRCKINCSRIEKARLFKGEKGTYLDCAIIPLRQPDQKGNTHVVIQDVTRDEREKGVKGTIIGSAKLFEQKPKSSAPENARAAAQPPRARKW